MENILGLDGVTALILTGLVMGGAEMVKRLFSKDWKAAAIIAVAASIGGAAGYIMGIEALRGIAFGLAASGYITLVQNFGSKNGSSTNS